MLNILITGGGGFIGASLAKFLANEDSYKVHVTFRELPNPCLSNQISQLYIGDINSSTDWSRALAEVDVVVHTAGCAHNTAKGGGAFEEQVFAVNTFGTLNLAQQSAIAGVKRFIFLSSIGVNGSMTKDGSSFSETDNPCPSGNYAISKFMAECGLRKIAENEAMEIVIIRPPLVYGFAAPGNFAKLLKMIRVKLPLPLGSVDNRRSFIGVDNLVDFIAVCISHTNAANELFLISDGRDLSIHEFILMISNIVGVKCNIFSFPVRLLKCLAFLFGAREIYSKLCCNLQISNHKSCRLLGWTPPISVEDGLIRALK
jgi:nucleoside-diphosphate-sugar epimerase